MRTRWLTAGWGVVCITLAANAAYAQSMGSVTTAPATSGQAAPVMSGVLLGVLSALLLCAGAYALRVRSVPRVVVGLAAALAIGALVDRAPGGIGVVITEGECTEEHTETYSGSTAVLMSECPNPIRITELIECASTAGEEPGRITPSCQVGLILGPMESCQLPPPNCPG